MKVDIVNFLAIELLELLGNDYPNQGQIDLVESLLNKVIIQNGPYRLLQIS